MSPYRTPPPPAPAETQDVEAELFPDMDLFPVVLVFWLAGIVRLIVGVASHETFGAGATLTFYAVLGTPYFFRDVLARWRPKR